MLTFMCRLGLMTLTVATLSTVVLAADGNPVSLYSSLARSAPELNPTVLKSALNAVQCAVNNGEERSERLAVIDYSQPSTARRLWIFDLRKKTLVLRDLVAHGAKSGKTSPPSSPIVKAATSPAWACSVPRKVTWAPMAIRYAWTAWSRASMIRRATVPW